MLYWASCFTVKGTIKCNMLKLKCKMKDLKPSLILLPFSRYGFQSANSLKKKAEISVKI